MSNPTIEDRLEWTLADNVRQAMEIERLSSEGAAKDSLIMKIRAQIAQTECTCEVAYGPKCPRCGLIERVEKFVSEGLREKQLSGVKNDDHEPCCEKRDVIEDDKGALSCGNCGEDIF